jgi:hypothetical protein
MHHAPHSSLACLLGEMLRLEEMKPQVPVRLHPQIPLADRREDGSLRDGVGGEVMKLHLVVVESASMKRLSGIPIPLSWKATKLTMYPSGGVGSRWSDGGTLHSG